MADILEQNSFDTVLVSGELYILINEGKIASFCILSHNYCIKDALLCPWIGFVFTSEEYRGHRCNKIPIDRACDPTKALGYNNIYIATNHLWLYEKYGFVYNENKIDIYGDDSRIYYKNLIE